MEKAVPIGKGVIISQLEVHKNINQLGPQILGQINNKDELDSENYNDKEPQESPTHAEVTDYNETDIKTEDTKACYSAISTLGL